MRKTLLLSIILLSSMPGIQKSLIAQEKTSLNQVVNTLKERISLAGYAQLGYTYDDAAKPDNTFDIKRIIFMAHGKITKRWTCDFMYDFYNGGMLLEVYTDYQFLPGLTARIGEFKVPYTIENELSPTTVELINCYSQSVCYLAGVSGSDKCYGMTSGRDIGMMIHGKLFHDFLQYKVAVMNGQGLNTKDKNSQKDVVGNLMIYPLEWLSVGGSFIRGTGNILSCRSLRKLTQISFSSSIRLLLSRQYLPVPAHHIRPLFHQQPGVRVLRVVEDVLKISLVHHAALVKHHDPVRYPGDGVQIVGDKYHGSLFFLLDPQKLIQNLILGDGVNGGGRLVRNQKDGFHSGGNSNHDSLEHSAGELMGILIQYLLRIADTHFFQ